MRSTKHLALVALTALSLWTGTAMAQEGGQDYQIPYWTLARQADALRLMEARNAARNASHVQAGSSDVNTTRPGISHVPPFNSGYTTLANPG